jgi:hypothetical protein
VSVQQALTDQAANLVADLVTNQMFLALFDTDPLHDGSGGAEITAAGYARVRVFFNNPAAGGTIANTADWYSPVATADWGSIGGYALFDDATAGQQFVHGALDTARTVLTNGVLFLPAGALVVNVNAP